MQIRSGSICQSLSEDRVQQRTANLHSHAGAPHRQPLPGSFGAPKWEPLLQTPADAFSWGCCVPPRAPPGGAVCHPGPLCTSWGCCAPLCAGQGCGYWCAACEFLGTVPPGAPLLELLLVSFEDGKNKKSSLAFVLNSDQLLTSTVSPLQFLQFLPTQSTLLAPSFQFSDVDNMNIPASPGTDHRARCLSSEK